jgi:hypothetical protein
MKYVQFFDESQAHVAIAFASPQDPDVFPDLIEVEDDDPRYLALINPSATVTPASQ